MNSVVVRRRHKDLDLEGAVTDQYGVLVGCQDLKREHLALMINILKSEF